MTNQSGNTIVSFTTINCEVPCVKYYNDMFVPIEYTINVSVAYNVDYSEDDITYEVNKLKFWLDETMRNCLIVDATHDTGIKIGLLSTNPLMHIPGVPNDALVAHVLQRKCRSITSGALMFLSFKLTGSESNTTTHFSADILPESSALPVDATYAAIPVYGNDPWWKRPDGFCYEFMELEGQSFEEAYGNTDDYDLLCEFDQSYNLAEELLTEAEEDSTEVIKPNWTPKRV